MSTSTTPAGWYPQVDGQRRYWDGEAWTDHVAPGGEAVIPPKKPWYRKKRIILPSVAMLILVGLGAIGSTQDPSGTSVSSTSAANQAAAEKEVTDESAANQAAADKEVADKAAADKEVADKAAADKAAADKAVADKAAADKAVADKTAADKAVADKTAADQAAADEAAADEAAAAEKIADANRLPVAQQNAKRSAESYLEMSGFSRSGLIEQLKYEGFAEKDSKRAIESMEVNWNTEADQSAKSYVDMSGFSRSGLIEQLEYEGYTRTQATHGANSVGL